jgi:hypothetical protein
MLPLYAQRLSTCAPSPLSACFSFPCPLLATNPLLQITEDTHGLLGPLQADFEPREAVVVKGKGIMQTYVLRGEAAERLRAEGVSVTGSAYGGLGAR